MRKADMQRAMDAFVGKIGTGTTALFYSAARTSDCERELSYPCRR